MKTSGTTVRTAVAAFALLICASGLHATKARPDRVVSTSDIVLILDPSGTQPSVFGIGSVDVPGHTEFSNRAQEQLPATVEIDGAAVPVRWQHKEELDFHKSPGHVFYVYESAEPHLRLRWEWEARANFGPIEHRIFIENLGDREVWLPMVDSLRLDLRVPATEAVRNFFVEKGAGAPSAQGTHDETMGEGYRWTGTSSTYTNHSEGAPREIIPAEIVYFPSKSRSGWYAGIEFSGRTRISLERDGTSLKTALGLNPEPGPFRTRLVPGGGFETPTVYIGAFKGGPDDAGNQLRPWVRAVLGNPLTWKDEHYPMVVNNSWGSGMAIDEPLALRMIAESKELGVEMFHIDAGWFRGVGDWYPDPKKFPHGLAVIADEAHRQGLRFGIWTDWTQAALDTEPGALNVHDPKVRDWLVTDLSPDWKPEEFKGQTIDLGVPAAHEHLQKEVKRIVEDYRLDMLEHDG